MANDEKTKVRLMEVVWTADGRSSQSRLVAEFNGGSDSTQRHTYEIESNASGSWMCVGNFDNRNEAVAAARAEANGDQCKVKVMEMTYDEVSRTFASKLLMEFNGGLLNQTPKYVPTDSAGRRRL
jgi:hypothetical protein